MLCSLKNEIEQIYPSMVSWRRKLHQNPELSFQEHETAEFIYQTLCSLGLDDVKKMCNTCVVGVLKGTAGEGKCLAIRADIDALPITEQTGLPYASEKQQVMHACCHDGHTAILLGAAMILAAHRDQLNGSVKFIFQNGEEVIPGGAKSLVEAGVLENPSVDAIIGLHLVPSEEENVIQVVPGPMTEGGKLVHVHITSIGGHVAQPNKGRDVILAGSQFVVALQQIMARCIDPDLHATVCSGQFIAGSQPNILPQEAYISINPRYYDQESEDIILSKIEDIAAGIERMSGCRFQVDVVDTNPCTFNDPELTDLIRTVAVDEWKLRCVPKHSGGGDDFAFYSHLTGIPGVYFVLWSGHEGDQVCGLHNARLTWKEETMKNGVAIFVETAVRFLDSLGKYK